MEFDNLHQLLTYAVETHDKPDAILYKEGEAWKRISSKQWLEKARQIALGLEELGVGLGDKVALLSENRPEWFLMDSALQVLGAVNVPIYATLTAAQIAYIVEDSEAKLLVASNEAQQRKIQEIRPELEKVESYLTLDAPMAGYSGQTLESIREKGATKLESFPKLPSELSAKVSRDSLATIIYTSGTTGDPKGVMLTHQNLVSNVLASKEVLPFSKDDVALSALPYSHVFERMVALYLYPLVGVTIALAESVEKVVENFGEIRPTIMTMVPRFFEKMHSRVMESAAQGSPTKQKIFHWALATGREHGVYRQKGETAPVWLELKYKLATALVFKKLHQRLGGRLRFFVSGGAPLSKEIAEFFWAAGICILEGYGLTETSPVISVNRPDRFKFGTVGVPIPGVEVKIAEDGEVLARGPNIMKGYFKKEEATKEAIDEDGFFHTGDVGIIDGDGFLTITDRKKDLIVTAGGKNIAPQPIEGRLKTNPYITEIVVVGNQRKFPSALVVPDFEKLAVWCREHSIAADDPAQMIDHAEVAAFILKQVEAMTEDLASFEKIKKISLISKEFTLAGGELTPTMKVKRRVIETRYKDLIDRMYD